MTTATLDRTSRITRRLDSTYTKIERLYAYARIIPSKHTIILHDIGTHEMYRSFLD